MERSWRYLSTVKRSACELLARVAQLPLGTKPQRESASALSVDPVDAAVELLSKARKAVEDAAEDEGVRAVRSGEEAERQQNAIRRIGRILAKVKVDVADDATSDGNLVVDTEIVED
ncbi:hypothetical protein ACFVZD_37125 [Streptomyces sp. NPDC058287]|uniref:hypothetical protein n=1 Tax=Streptomyces sp. NPDC058287 TaxID=3346423 RepID=UPI0036E4B8C9